MHVITDKVNVNCQAGTSQQAQCAAADQDQLGVGRDAFPHALQDGLDFGVIQEIQAFLYSRPFCQTCAACR